MIKKIWIPVLVLCLALCAVGCGKEPEPTYATSKVVEDIEFTLAGEGTEESPYLIATREDLLQFAAVMNHEKQHYDYSDCHFRLTADIALNDCSNFDNWDQTAPANIWTPIAYYYSFKGIFDGNGHTISGLYMDQSVSKVEYDGYSNVMDKFGLFGNVTGEIKNLIVEKAYVHPKRNGEDRPQNVGIIAGSAGTITGCTAEGVVICEGFNCGGIAGRGSTITDCAFEGTMLEKSGCSAGYIGGIAGSSATVIRDCSVSAQLISEYTDELEVRANIGGIAGSHSGLIENCTFDGEIISGDYAGGILGYGSSMGSEDETVVRNCTNNGSITAAEDAGGIVGSASDVRNSEFRVEGCTNNGPVHSLDADGVCAAGGIVGYIDTRHSGSVVITGCTNKAELRDSMPSGIVGRIAQNTGKIRIEKCTNKGAIFSEGSYAGGILCHILQWGDGWTLDIDQCINEGDITTDSNAGGIVCFAYDVNPNGTARTLTISGCVNRGNLRSTGTNNFMGGILGVNTLQKTPVTITSCVNEGDLEYTSEVVVDAETLSGTLVTLSRTSGGIVGYVGAAPYFTLNTGERTLNNINSEEAYLNIVNCSSTGKLLHKEAVLADDVTDALLERWRASGCDNVLNFFISLEGGIVGTIADNENYSVKISGCSYENAEREIDDWNRFDTGK